ncbi:MAG: DUF5106 domain-containing protein [Bacteroidales bacterium]|nr:DUF5106 domain-containing protein [Bacteroidales bacterium]
MRKSLILLIPVILVFGCKGHGSEEIGAVSFPVVMPPAMMDSPQDRADYLAMHYWDAFTDTSRTYPTDTSLVGGVRKTELEQKFSDWVSCLNIVQMPLAMKAAGNLFSKVLACEVKDSSSTIFENINELVYKYLYDPNSPLRNEDVYGVYASRLSSCSLLDSLRRESYGREARLCALNRVGTKATDFRFCDKNGRMHSLHCVKADWILLFFSNPGCQACMEIIEGLKSLDEISMMIRSSELAVLNIYIDEDIEAWRSYMPIYPKEWYNGFDPDYVIRTDELYNVRAIPSLYVLDSQKNVVMKDAVPDKVFSFFCNLVN